MTGDVSCLHGGPPPAVTLRDRRNLPFRVRCLGPGDAAALGRLFDSLTAATRRVFGPHPLDHDHARLLCAAIDPCQCLRFVAEGPLDEEGRPRQVPLAAYMILEFGVHPGDRRRYAEAGHDLDDASTATFAPLVGEAWQEQGLGSAMMPVVMAAARRAGRSCVVLMGGVRDDNPRARHFYAKHGFQRVRGFRAGGVDNHDMMLRL